MTSSIWSWFGGNSSHQLWTSTKFPVIKNITIKQPEIGRGACGLVFDADYEGTICAAKEIHHNLMTGDNNSNTVVESFIKEISILSRLRHPNIVYFLGIHCKEQSNVPVLIMEKMWMSLDAFVSEQTAIPDIIKIKILKDIACGLVYLHSQTPPMIHRDLTSSNVLLNENLNAKIADLGLVRVLETITKEQLTTAPGTIAFMPPEALLHNPVYTDKLDVFSFGCVILHTVTQEFPSPTDEHKATDKDKNMFSKVPELIRRANYLGKMNIHPCLSDLVSNCLKDEPNDRPDSKRIHGSIEQCLKDIMNKQDCQSSSKDKLSLISAVEELKLKHHTQEQDILNFRDKISNQQATIDAQDLQIGHLKSQHEKFQQDISQQSDSDIVMNLNDMLKQEHEDVKEKEKEIESWKIKLNTLQKAMATLRKKSEEKEQGLSREVQELVTSLKSKDIKVATLQKANDDLQSLVNTKELEIDQLKSKCEKLEEALSPTSIQQNNTKDQREVSQLKNQIRDLEKKMTKNGKEKEQLQKQYESKLSSMEEKMKSEYEKYKQELSQHSKKEMSLKETLQEAEEALKNKEKVYIELKKETKKLQQNDTKDQQENEQLKDKVKDLEERVSEVTKETEQLQKQHKHKISVMEELTAKLNEAEKSLENKEKEILRLSALLHTDSSERDTSQQTEDDEEVRNKPESHMKQRSEGGAISQQVQKDHSKLQRSYQKLKRKYDQLEQKNNDLQVEIKDYLDQIDDSFNDINEKEDIVQTMIGRQKKLRKHLQSAYKRRSSSTTTKVTGASNCIQSTDNESFTENSSCFDSSIVTSEEHLIDYNDDDSMNEQSPSDEKMSLTGEKAPEACESDQDKL